MKILFTLTFICVAQYSFSQGLFSNTNGSASQVKGISASQFQGFGGSGASDEMQQPLMHASAEPGIAAYQYLGDGTGTMVMLGMAEQPSLSFGIGAGLMYMPQLGAYVLPLFATVRQNLWMTRYNDNAVFGSMYVTAGAGPVIGIGCDPFASSFFNSLGSLTFREGGGAMAALGAEIGGERLGLSLYVMGGLNAYGFLAQLGTQKSIAGPFMSFGLREAVPF